MDGVSEVQRFERALAEVSAGFVNIPAAEVDGAVTNALRRIAQLLAVDRATLLRPTEDGVPAVTHSGSVDGVPAVAPRLLPMYPWTFAQARAGRHVAFSHLDELPADAAHDKASWQRVGVKSNLTVPMEVGGRFEGLLALGCLRQARAWPEELVARVRLLATILGNALAHKRAQDELEVAMRFERLLSHALASLLTVAREELDEAITAVLHDAAHVLHAERATLWQRSGNATEIRKTHRWLAPGVTAPADVTDMVRLPWAMGEILAGRAVSFSLADLPSEAAPDRPVLESMNIRSLVIVPLVIGGGVTGALSFASADDERGWPQSLVPRVQLLGEMLASVLARARAERSERDARAEAAHAARLGTMGVVAASLAHELTQPLAAIMSNAETARALLAGGDLDRDELRDTLDDILADDRRAGTLIHQLRRFLRRDDVDRAQIDVRELLAEVLALVHGEAIGKNVQVTLHAGETLPPVTGNHALLQQIVLNLLLNGFDAVAGNAAGARRVTVTASEDSGRVHVEVADNGAGMDAAALARAFTPFYTTKPKGMGLGLAISRSIAESHGGTLTVRSQPRAGSVFRLELPV